MKIHTHKNQINKPQIYEKGKTIGRNQQKKAELIFKNATDIVAYTLDNGFTGKSCNKLDYKGDNWMWQEWTALRFAKLTEYKNNKYELYIHSNCWYKFKAKIN